MLNPKHLEEWRQSGVRDAIAYLNCKSLKGYGPHQYLCGERLERTNTGRLTSYWIKRYSHTERGGWWCNGLDPISWDLMDWGCFKPDYPKQDEDGKIIKYEHPAKTPTRAFFLRIDYRTGLQIARTNGIEKEYRARILQTYCRKQAFDGATNAKTKGFKVPRKARTSRGRGRTGMDSRIRRTATRLLLATGLLDQEDKGFWKWAISHKLPITITEGVKKAACLLSHGYTAIALPGIHSGFRRLESGEVISRQLIPELKCVAGCPIYICFDRDPKPKTQRAVGNAIATTAPLLIAQGSTVRVVTWAESEKGVDDFVVAHGKSALEHAFETALSFDQWRCQSLTRLTFPAAQTLNQQFCGKLSVPKNAKIIGLKAPKGSGKTESIAQLVAEELSEGRWVLVLTHRVQLGEALCQRFGVPYVAELRNYDAGKLQGFGLCIDSLRPNSQARFSADAWMDGTIVVDECEQVFWHALNSSTCQSDRVSILQQLKQLFINAFESEHGRVILSDADLSDVSVEFVLRMAGKGEEEVPVWIVTNEVKAVPWKVNHYHQKSPEGLVSALKQHIHEGGHPFICCSAQTSKSKWGSRNLEAYLKKAFPDKSILRIDSESVADPSHPAYGCIANLNKILANWDIVITSPSIETGVSIDLRGHFTSVWGIFQGVTAENSVRQSLARVREAVPRFLWLAPTGINRIANGSISYKSILKSEDKLTKANVSLLKAVDSTFDLDFQSDQPALRTWAKFAARHNGGMVSYRQSVLDGLRREGHVVVDDCDSASDKEEIKAEITACRDQEHQAEAQAIAQAIDISPQQYEILKAQKAKNKEERHQERKHFLQKRYCLEVTTDLVLKDADRWYPAIALHYYFTVGRHFLAAKNLKKAKAQAEAGGGAAWMPDFTRSQLGTAIHVLENLGCLTLLNPHREFRRSDPDLVRMAELARANKWNIRAALGISIINSDTPVAIAQKLLGKLGLKLRCLRREGPRGNRVRVYGLTPPGDEREKVFAVWFIRDQVAKDSGDEVVSRGGKLDSNSPSATPNGIGESTPDIRACSPC